MLSRTTLAIFVLLTAAAETKAVAQPIPPAQPGPPPLPFAAQPTPAPAAPDGSVDTLEPAAPAAPLQQPGESAASPDLAWYRPISADMTLEERSHERFVTGIVNAHTFAKGPIRGNGSEVLASFNFNWIFGLDAGFYMPNGSFVAGGTALRYAGINLPGKGRTFGLTILVPTVEVHYAFSPSLLYIGSGLTGIRMTSCPFVVDVRLPNITVWQPIPLVDATKPSLSVGASASFGFMF